MPYNETSEPTITSTEITELARCCKNTPYAKLMDGIATLTEEIEKEYLFNVKSDEGLAEFRGTFNKKFYQLYDRVFAPLKVQPELPTTGSKYSINSSTSRVTVNRVEQMSTCLFVNGEPKMISPQESTHRTLAIQAVADCLPEGYDVEFVCNTQESRVIVAVGKAKTLYLVDHLSYVPNKIQLTLLSEKSLLNIPLLLMSPVQCDESHVREFIKGFVNSFNYHYPKCDWNRLTENFKDVVYEKFHDYMRIWGYDTMTTKNRFVGYLHHEAINFNSIHRFQAVPVISFKLFQDEQTKMREEYMDAFCHLYRERKMFPKLDAIQHQVSLNRR